MLCLIKVEQVLKDGLYKKEIQTKATEYNKVAELYK